MTSLQILVIFYVILISFTIFLLNQLFKNRSLTKTLQEENSNLKEKVSGFRTYMPGRKGLISNYGLTVKSTDTNFKVDYEVEIMEVSENKVKVSAYDFTSIDSYARDPANKQAILLWFQNQWVSKKQLELLTDKTDIRDSKIEQILS
mgnify:CR=1 FL=1